MSARAAPPLRAGRGGGALSGPLAGVVAWRFLRGSKSRLLDGTARAALAATALGVAAMIVAMALMTGYREDLQRKLVEGNAPVVLQSLAERGQDVGPEMRAALAALPGVEKLGRVAYGQGTLSAGDGEGVEVTLRGVDPGGGQLAATAAQLAPGDDGVPGTVLGAELAHRLGVAVGDSVRLVALGFADGQPRFRYQSLRVTGTFATGYAEFDAGWLLVERERVRELAGGEGVELVEMTLADPHQAERVAAAAEAIVGPDWVVSDWRHLNRELFSALQIQQLALFLVLGLIVLVSTFNVSSTLVVLVRDRMRDLGVLAALGMTPATLRRIFLVYGAALGTVGIALGVAVGTGTAWVLTTFELIRFDAEVAAIYFIDSVPFRVEAGDLAAVVAFAVAVNLAACLVPAARAARLDPAAALRYE